MKRITLLVNGPGELWGWARPLCAELRNRKWHVTLQLLPCPFASGQEFRVAEGLAVDEVLPALSLPELAARLGREHSQAVVQLGGDLLWGRICAARAGASLGCYTYGFKPGLSRCERVWTAFPWMAERMGHRGIRTKLTGDLVRDGLEMDRGACLQEDIPVGERLVFFPGSRPAIREKAREYLGEVFRSLCGKRDAVKVVTPLSPFCEVGEFERWSETALNPTRLGAGGVLPGASLALTQPGTNTLELMHAGIPGLVAVPFHFLRQVPLSGLKGIVAGIPFVGGALKERYLRRLASRKSSLAWPNRLAGSELLWERVGELSPENIAEEILDLLEDRRELKRRAELLKRLSGSEGAAERLADEIEEMVR